MTYPLTRAAIALGLGAVLAACSPMMSTGTPPTTLDQAVNLFESGVATGGAMLTVDAGGPVAITDAVELPKFAFAVYDVDVSEDSVTMTLVADLAKLQVTLYDATTFDRYYFAFDQEVTSATLSGTTDPNFNAEVEIVAPGTTITAAGAFVDGLPTEFTLENGGILVTMGEGTDLTKITENGGALTVDF
ncbi:MAG: hypothetical protein AAFR93_11170 [Pseudomonadota bacterium]